jgi:hypothetical protein
MMAIKNAVGLGGLRSHRRMPGFPRVAERLEPTSSGIINAGTLHCISGNQQNSIQTSLNRIAPQEAFLVTVTARLLQIN